MLVIIGSPRPHSSTGLLAAACADAVGSTGGEVRSVELARVPRCELSRLALPEKVDAVDAIVLASPVHHSGYSGLLKTALDELPATGFAGKAVGLVAHGAGPRSGNVVCDQLRTVARSLGGWVVPTQIAACPEDFVGVREGRGSPSAGTATVPDTALADRLVRFAAELHRCAAMLSLTVGTRAEAGPV
ncbi:NADPH-dependent FMN reductase [Streptomyces sp. NPDC094448]|uniref:NADPH-dependent FMN reductase n=1 Tax=Streptomyces sp. NPDC094448 TaxID=3366063 RepID=UPI003805DDDE